MRKTDWNVLVLSGTLAIGCAYSGFENIDHKASIGGSTGGGTPTSGGAPGGEVSTSSQGGTGATGGSSAAGGATSNGGIASVGGSSAASGTISNGGATAGTSSIASGGASAATGGGTSSGGSLAEGGSSFCVRQTSNGGNAVSPTCGDGIVQVGEQCDDRNSPYPGCSATCQIESGYKCPFAGAPCVPVCGDGILVQPAEQCDPGMTIPNIAQACNSNCTVNPGWACNTTSCHQTVCGDGVVEGTEGCDPLPFNHDLGDGCTPLCAAEPSCPSAGGGCTTKCGDGLVLGSEQCDDGNVVSGDGCSSTCQIEPGFTCAQPPPGDTIAVPMVVRDFNAGGDFEKGASFATGLNYANQGLLQNTLDTNGLKPILASPTGTYNGTTGQDSGIASTGSFAQFYNDVAPTAGNTRNLPTVATTLPLYLKSDGSAYVNRFGNNGDGLTSTQYQRTHTNQCGNVDQSNHDANHNVIPCTSCLLNSNTDQTTPCTENDTTSCQTDPTYTGQCVANGNAWEGTFLDAAFDGNPLWFPADSITPYSPSSTAQISGNYDPSWPSDSTGKQHNFSFTTEVRFWFQYDSSKTYELTFMGEDDAWVFVNKRLAVDLGGIHTSVQGVLTFGGTGTTTVNVTPTNVTPMPAAITGHPNLGLTNGSVYEIAVFQAQRQTKASSYQLSLPAFAARSVCKPVCGGTNPAVSPGQQCNNGDASNCAVSATNDCYNQCTTSCTFGPYCGDGVVQSNYEECDDGSGPAGNGTAGSLCTIACKKYVACTN